MEPNDDQPNRRERGKAIQEQKTSIIERAKPTTWLEYCRNDVINFSDEEIDNIKKNDISSENLYELISNTDPQKFKDLFLQYNIKLPESGSEAKAIYKLIHSIPLTERYALAISIDKEFKPAQVHTGIFSYDLMKAMLECWCTKVNPTYDRLQQVIDVGEKMKFLKTKKNGNLPKISYHTRSKKESGEGKKTTVEKYFKLVATYKKGGDPEDRLEVVFQDETIKAFLGIAEFKIFARLGLCLDEQDIQDIVQNNKKNVKEQKLQFLNKWKENNGKQATVEKIRKLVATYKKGCDLEGIVAEEIVVDPGLGFEYAESRYWSNPDTALRNTEKNEKSPHLADDTEVNQLQSQIDSAKNKTEMKAGEKNSVTSIVNCEYKETMARVKELVEKIKSRQLEDLEELEFCLCHLNKEHLEFFLLDEVLKAVVCKISKLSIGFTENVTDLIPFYCQIASNYKSTNLSLKFNDLRNENIEALAENLNENDKYMELDFSYNKNIKPDGYETVGKIVRKHEIRTLKLADCDISDGDLEFLFKGMGNAKLEVLDISCNNNVTTKGFEHIGKQIAQKRIKRLKLSDTQLNVDTLNGFYEKVAGSIEDSEGHQVLVKELDVSYNSTMKPKAYKVLGSMVKLFGVKTLNLAGCGLGEEHLKHLREEMNPENSTEKNEHYTKMESLNARDNKVIGKGIDEIAKIVKECELKELDISECRLSANGLNKFIAALENAKLKCLYLGEERQFDKIYITEVCKLLPHIKEMLRLKGTVCTDLRKMLQEKLNKLEDNELEIQLDDDTTLCSQIEDDVPLSNSS